MFRYSVAVAFTLRSSCQYILHQSFLLFLLTLYFNMALRANTASPQRDNHHSLLPGLPLFWSDPSKLPAMEWERWFDVFTVTVMAKYSISVEELTWTVDAEHPRVKALIGDMPAEAAEKKLVTWLFLSVGEPARKMFIDKYPKVSVWTLRDQEMIERCVNCFHVACKRTLDRHRFLSRKQPEESLQQFWHSINGLTSRSELEEITQTLVHDVFILNMNNQKAQEKLCVDPYENPQDTLQYAIFYGEGIKRQMSMGVGVAEGSKVAVKSEPVYSVDKVNRRECFVVQEISR